MTTSTQPEQDPTLAEVIELVDEYRNAYAIPPVYYTPRQRAGMLLCGGFEAALDGTDPSEGAQIVRDLLSKASPEARIRIALNVVEEYGLEEGEHHKQWVLDQVVRAITGPNYEQWRQGFDDSCNDEDEEEYMEGWDSGIAP